jgi:hypothetical protein
MEAAEIPLTLTGLGKNNLHAIVYGIFTFYGNAKGKAPYPALG